jgi:glycosyltransferase involved in cell wall biosynthesis
MMHIWLITVGEPLPVLSGSSRLWRTGMLAQEMSNRGHTVTWWTSRVDHFRKEYFSVDGSSFQIAPNFVLRILDGRLYTRNVSVARLINHWQLGRAFRDRIKDESSPDLVLCSFPTIELSGEAVRFGRERKIPVVLDVRDLWPDVFLQAVPAAIRGMARLLLHRYFSAARSALSEAQALIAVSRGYLEWALSRAERNEGPFDRVFPLAYSLPKRTPSSRLEGIEILRKLGVKHGSLACLFAGTLGRTYDLSPVLEVARKLSADADLRFHFVVCGDGERAAEWRQMAAGLPNVSFTGWLAQTELRAVLMGCDIGLAAYAEAAPQGLPNKVIEYMAAGLPVVSSLTGETEQILHQCDCGRSYEAGNSLSLYCVLQELESSDVRERLAAQARAKFESDFQAERIYAELASYLEAMVGRDELAL